MNKNLTKWICFMGSAFILIFLFNACNKDDSPAAPINNAPIINSVTAQPDRLAYGETSNIVVNATDQDNDNLTYEWTCDNGNFTGATTSSTASWLAPYQQGSCYLDVKVKDGTATTTSGVNIQVMGLFFDEFSSDLAKWITSYSDAWISNSEVHIKGNTNGFYGTLYHALSSYVAPQYTLQITITNINTMEANEFYALYSKVNDSGSITIRYWMFAIEPNTSGENWALLCFVSGSGSSAWVLLASDSFGESSLIHTGINQVNELSYTIEPDKTVILKVGNQLLYQSDEILNIENTFGMQITMDLVRVGCRTFYQREVKMDDATVITPSQPLSAESINIESGSQPLIQEDDVKSPIPMINKSELITLREFLTRNSN
ncbi:hypothetical protein BMS3Abin03_01568 [bacterium BMS3Abin03]|nr:hypothetical protein BMS3Abin03_01568 [bacterium BMS3Abin03]